MSKGKIGSIEINIVTSEILNHDAETTDHPVEKGEDVSDHTKTKLPTIAVTGVLLGDDAGSKLQKLIKYQKDGELISFTSRTAYNNMFVLSIKTDHNVRVANGLQFDIILKQVRVTKAKSVEITVVSPTTKKPSPQVSSKVKKTNNNGRQQVKSMPDPRVNLTGYNAMIEHNKEINSPQVNMREISNKYTDPIGFFGGGL